MNPLQRIHPIVLLLYYIIMILPPMILMNPYVAVLSLLGGLSLYGCLTTPKVWLKDFLYYIVVFILITITNPLFAHKGRTVLFFMNNNPITYEAFVYGGSTASLIIAILYWCKCYQLIISTDQFLFLLDKPAPKLALVLSMALRFIPVMKNQRREVSKIQKTMGFYITESLFERLRNSLRLYDSVITWGLENSIETADSMQARGYGTDKRSHYRRYTFRKEDGVGILILGMITALLIVGYEKEDFMFQYYPSIRTCNGQFSKCVSYGMLTFLAFLPSIIVIKERIKWNYLKSKI